MELWDAYDAKGQLIAGMTLTRGEPVPDGLYHLVCDILVQHMDGTYLLMQRDRRKHFGGMWEASAGGSALQGETAFDCACRELREETGISAQDLHELGCIVHHAHHTIYTEYLCITNHDKTAVVLQEGETQAFRWVTREALVNMEKQELVTNRAQIFLPELQR